MAGIDIASYLISDSGKSDGDSVEKGLLYALRQGEHHFVQWLWHEHIYEYMELLHEEWGYTTQ
ncbi:uncharacterized protein ACLA_006930 [Aspergillus clavatus NRRL 1]|uniref:Uncharacterized protein n=1 Tax=Aspergillus clavatus (strain ATCC 1007 / CBS 513.65 / DSM 816 / NCTC 3887 / NRRL 1 / QM 1276 / 107) TaxID=344612 RepID=A1CDK7_ASPCL|nr:uncharacterized protein ACLA_006930 [Aspergillus clavatus NRRL 1]EAW11934.1 hypothetical protein ACLA_006930 [Aspergillus clavatus NRRL 1]